MVAGLTLQIERDWALLDGRPHGNPGPVGSLTIGAVGVTEVAEGHMACRGR